MSNGARDAPRTWPAALRPRSWRARLRPGAWTASLRALVRRLSVAQVFAAGCGLLLAIAVAGTVAGVLALQHVADARNELLMQIDPARTSALRLGNGLVEQESGVRGFVLVGGGRLLTLYEEGREEERTAFLQLHELTSHGPLADVRPSLLAVDTAASRWRERYAAPIISRQRTTGTGAQAVREEVGKGLFAGVRAALARLNGHIAHADAHARASLSHSITTVNIIFAIFAALLLCGAVALMVALRGLVSKPLARLGRQAREVARGAFESPLEVAGPRDVAGLAEDVDSMRMRILRELTAIREANERLDLQATELSRSNRELEEFAYIASHDLQEPLRKVAGFTRLLERRYKGDLDERADEYITFAVDGATRMQALITDLLAFSRVGRPVKSPELVQLGDVLADALERLEAAIEESDATIEADRLPTVRGEPGLLALVFQNLIANALKFHNQAKPHVRIGSELHGQEWLIWCADNGIGIDPEYRERIFVIFQRLHPREHHPGTGIGLAICRKIVEYHGGRIWVEPEAGGGSRFQFTLPALDDQA